MEGEVGRHQGSTAKIARLLLLLLRLSLPYTMLLPLLCLHLLLAIAAGTIKR